MRIDIISVAPDLLESPFNHSIIKRAKEKGLAEIIIHDLRAYGLGNYKQIDDTQFGGGAGMVMMIEPIANCIKKDNSFFVGWQKVFQKFLLLKTDEFDFHGITNY